MVDASFMHIEEVDVSNVPGVRGEILGVAVEDAFLQSGDHLHLGH